MLDIRKLSKDELSVLVYLQKHDKADAEDLSAVLGMDHTRTLRALQWLSNKGFIELKSTDIVFYKRTSLGDDVARIGLPEERLLRKVSERPIGMHELRTIFEPREFNVSIGMLKKMGAIEIGENIIITPKGKEQLSEGFELSKILSNEIITKDSVSDDTISSLLDRGLYIKQEGKSYAATINGEARQIEIPTIDFKEKLTPEMLKTGDFKNFAFRSYDVTARVPPKYNGRRHFINEATEFVRSVWIDMGFTEMRGDHVQASFWNFDALFTPQDHPARDMQDTFFIKKPQYGELGDNRTVSRVRKTHIDGWTTKSKGYGTSWKRKEASRLVLRTHTTVLSARMIASMTKDGLPAKFFSVGKVYRNETLDWKHLFEFDQVEGIVISKDVTFKHLKGYLEQFFSKLGYDTIRIRPAYFPYTEMSVEVDVLHPKKNQWVELGGAGIFRPEVVKPLIGIEVPVLAWGLGFGRIISEYYNITDLRDYHKNDIRQLREMRGWI
jgi:phenylalanyl-tRNA synthetase alpha chain